MSKIKELMLKTFDSFYNYFLNTEEQPRVISLIKLFIGMVIMLLVLLVGVQLAIIFSQFLVLAVT